MNEIKKRFSDKSGIAFIITLGLLALLMITGVSFAVFMKTEREAAGNAALLGLTRQLAQSGIAKAMDDINVTMLAADPKDDAWYPSELDKSGDPTGWYIDNPVVDSSVNPVVGSVDDLSDYTELYNDLYFNNMSARKLIPLSTFTNALKFCQIDAINPNIDIFGQGEDFTSRGDFSYIVVNLSGLFDLNFSGELDDTVGPTTQYDLTKIPGLKNVSNFITARQTILNNNEFYESLAYLKDETWIDFDNLAGFCTYSLFLPLMDFDGITEAPLKQKASDYNTAALKQLDKQLQKSNIDYLVVRNLDREYQPDSKLRSFVVIQNLIDYLDEDYLPGGPEQGAEGYKSSSVEPFPMINEIKFTTKLDKTSIASGSGSYKARYAMEEFWIELWYPFVSPKCSDVYGANDLTLECVFHFPDIQDRVDIFPTRSKKGSFDSVNVDPSTRTITFSKEIGTFDGFQTEKVGNFFQANINASNFVAHAYDFTIYFEARVKDKNNVVLDGFGSFKPKPRPAKYMLEFPNTVNLNGRIDDFTKYCYAEISDPRRNYIPSEWNPSINDVAPNFTENNRNTSAPAPATADDQWWNMYVKGYKPSTPVTSLESVGELGYLFTGKPGQTVKLTGDSSVRSKIYDYLYIDGSLLSNGYANVNTEFTGVLEAALADMSKEPKSDGTMTKIGDTQDELDDLIDLLLGETLDGGICSTNLFDDAIQTKIFNTLSATNEFTKEAFYIYGYPAFHSRQNLFAILAKGNMHSTKQVCMAIVWRDPVADDKGDHPCFIREFVWLNGE